GVGQDRRGGQDWKRDLDRPAGEAENEPGRRAAERGDRPRELDLVAGIDLAEQTAGDLRIEGGLGGRDLLAGGDEKLRHGCQQTSAGGRRWVRGEGRQPVQHAPLRRLPASLPLVTAKRKQSIEA